MKAPHKSEKLETIPVEAKDVEHVMSSLCTTDQTPDIVFIGCPHCSISEVKRVAQALEGRKLRKDTELWICTSRYVKERTKNYVAAIERAGGRVLCDTCVLVTWIKDLGVDTLMTNSAKTAFYAPALNEVDVTLKPLNKCLKTICRN